MSEISIEDSTLSANGDHVTSCEDHVTRSDDGLDVRHVSLTEDDIDSFKKTLKQYPRGKPMPCHIQK